MNTYPTSDTSSGKWASIALTVLVHLALALFLFFGIRWQSEPPATLEVGLSAAPPPSPSRQPPPPEPEPSPQPKPLPKPPVVVPPVRPPEPQVKPPPSEIAVKKPAEKPPVPSPKPPPPKEDPPQPKKPADKPVDKPPVTAKKDPEPAVDPLNTEYLNKLLREETERTQRSNADADLQKRLESEARQVASNRNSDAYLNALRTKIRGNLIKPPGLTGNPEAEFSVEQLPSGEVIKVRLVRSSGIPALDEAIERSIHRSSPLPLPEKRDLFQREIKLIFRPLE